MSDRRSKDRSARLAGASLIVVSTMMFVGVWISAAHAAAPVQQLSPASGKTAAAPAAAAPAAAKSADPAKSATAELTADQIVARYITARGGLAKIKSITSLRQKGRAKAGPGRQGLVTRMLKRPGRIRFEFTVQGVTGVFVSDGKEGWSVSPFDGVLEPKPLPSDVLADATEQADIEGPLVDWQSKGHHLELLGRESLNGNDAYKLKLTMKSGGSRTEYIDAKTFYQVRSDSTRLARGRTVQISTTFADYQKTEGIAFPSQIEVQAAGRPQKLSITVDKVEVNPALSDDLFRIQPAAKP
jgi:outer membrane lipoprotein-sorting protein